MTFSQSEVERVAKGLTKARRKRFLLQDAPCTRDEIAFFVGARLWYREGKTEDGGDCYWKTDLGRAVAKYLSKQEGQE